MKPGKNVPLSTVKLCLFPTDRLHYLLLLINQSNSTAASPMYIQYKSNKTWCHLYEAKLLHHTEPRFQKVFSEKEGKIEEGAADRSMCSGRWEWGSGEPTGPRDQQFIQSPESSDCRWVKKHRSGSPGRGQGSRSENQRLRWSWILVFQLRWLAIGNSCSPVTAHLTPPPPEVLTQHTETEREGRGGWGSGPDSSCLPERREDLEK